MFPEPPSFAAPELDPRDQNCFFLLFWPSFLSDVRPLRGLALLFLPLGGGVGGDDGFLADCLSGERPISRGLALCPWVMKEPSVRRCTPTARAASSLLTKNHLPCVVGEWVGG